MKRLTLAGVCAPFSCCFLALSYVSNSRMFSAYFYRMIIDEAQQRVRIGPSPAKEWIDVDASDLEVRILARIARRGDVTDLEPIRRASGAVHISRQSIGRVRDRFRGHAEVPAWYAKAFIKTKKGNALQTYYLNPRIETQVVSGVLFGSDYPGEHRMIDASLHGITRAIIEHFGEAGLRRTISLLPEEVRQQTVDLQFSPGRWIPMRYVLEWMRAVEEGPANFNFDLYSSFLKTMVRYKISHLFVDSVRSLRVNRFQDVQNLWRRAYDSGELEAYFRGAQLDFKLQHHPYCASEFGRRTLAVSMCALMVELGVADARLVSYWEDSFTGALWLRLSGTWPGPEGSEP